MKVAEVFTLCFFLTDKEVLLGMKKRGFGKNKWNGFGGKVKKGEAIKSAAVREITEEVSLSIDEANLEQTAEILFHFEGKSLPFKCHVFTVKEWAGEPKESKEMKPQWYSLDKLPFNEMWPADCQWVPLVLSGKKIKAKVFFDTDGETAKDFIWEETVFE